MSDELKMSATLLAMAFYAVVLGAKLWPLLRRPLRRAVAFCRGRAVDAVVAVVFFGVAVHCGATKSTNGNDRVASECGSTETCKFETAIGEEMTRDAGVEGELRFTYFAVDTNAVHFAASLPAGIELPEGKIDLYAAYDVDTNVWELVGNYDIVPNETNLVDTVPLCLFTFPVLDRLFLALGTRADLDADGLIDARERFMYGTSQFLADTDADGLLDGEETAVSPQLDPLVADTDGDGYLDGEELLAGTSPLSHDDGAGASIRYYYDDDGRLTATCSGFASASSSSSLSPAGNPTRQASR